MSDSTPLFSTELISPEVVAQLPEGYHCRPLQQKDYHNGFLDVLRVLTTVGDISEEVYLPLQSPLLTPLCLRTLTSLCPKPTYTYPRELIADILAH